jgi:phosphocarrier protein FPr/phosphocarrier protein
VEPSKLILLAPLQGWCASLDEAPDAVFAGRMMGDGVAIDPTGNTLYAPCDGVLTVVPASKHAVTLRAETGAEILLHVGIDTVGLGGEGFEVHVREGQKVRAGDRLISFDLEVLAQRAKSLVTPVIVTDTMGFSIVRRSTEGPVEVGDFLMEIAQSADTEAAVGGPIEVEGRDRAAVGGPPKADGQPAVTGLDAAAGALELSVLVTLEHGIHARPAASLAAVVRGLAADVGVVFNGRRANAKSPVALMALGVRKGDRISIQASGADAQSAVAALERALTSEPHGAGEPRGAGVPHGAGGSHGTGGGIASGVGARANGPSSAKALKGVVASRGLGVGRAYQFTRTTIDVAEQGAGVARESAEFDRARQTVRAELEHSFETGNKVAKEIAEAHLGLIDDPELIATARKHIETGKSAGYAWRAALREATEMLRSLNDARMAERADDLLDLESRVLSVLGGGQPTTALELPPESVLIAQELLPSQLVALDGSKLAGICLAAGGATSHVAIIAAAMDIPTLVATGPAALRIPTGTPVVLDAESGWIYIDPPRVHTELARSQLAEKRSRRAAEQLAAQRECRTADGMRIEVFANLGSEAEAHAAVRNGAEGSGLLRTEFLFLERTAPPGEAEQLDEYQRIARALEGRPLTIRTLDIGGDKPIPYLPLPQEENPALGLRGLRTSLWRPDLLRAQLRAILRVRPVGQCRILLPMITDAGEVRAVRLMLDEIRREQGYREAIALGAMIETPASAVMADRIAREADFLSIGTNDLTQYTLAMDRGHPELAARLDALHPAVLRLIARVIEVARVHGRGVAVCGGLASDPVAVPILIGLGIHELSMVPAIIPQLKALISTLNAQECRGLAARALEQETPESVRSLTLTSVSGLDATGRARE